MIRERKFKAKIKGASPLILHNTESADPLNKWAKEMAPLKAKRKKTESDMLKIRELSFLSSLYWSKELNGLYLPTDNLQKMLLESARHLDQRGAKKAIVGIGFDTHLGWPLEVENRSDIKALVEDDSLRYNRIVTIQKAKVSSTRAIFKQWGFEMEVVIDDQIVDPGTVENWVSYAGKRVGLGCRRPYAPTPGSFGKFYLEAWEEIKE